jgi:hypothetical protein
MSISAACQDKLEAAGVRGDQFEFIAQWIATREFKRVKEGPDAMAAFDVAAAKAWTAWEAGSKTADQDLKDAAGDKAKVFLKVVGNSFAGKGPPGFDEATCKQNWQVFACTCNTLALGAAPSPAGCTTSYPEYDCAMPMPGKACKSSSSWGVWAALAIGVVAFVGAYAVVTRGSGREVRKNPTDREARRAARFPTNKWTITGTLSSGFIVTRGDPYDEITPIAYKFRTTNELQVWLRNRVGVTINKSDVLDNTGGVVRSMLRSVS